jgi:CRISPR/Cas system CMR-associated protein Cmr5 small subunit
MKTLAQIRAANALKWKDTRFGGQKGGDVVSGFPTLVRTDGLLAAAAFALEWKDKEKGLRKHEGAFEVVRAVADHLSSPGVAICQATEPDALVEELAQAADASQLRRATAEALAFLSYLKRFVA